VDNTADTINSIISDAGTGLNKQGTGKLTLGGVNTYTDSTTVNEGTLAIAGSINNSGVVTVNAGTMTTDGANELKDTAGVTVSGGVLTLGGNDTVGSFTIDSGSIGGAFILTAATYALQGGTVNANLGAGTVNVTTGTTTLNGTEAATTVNITSGTLALGGSDVLTTRS